MRKLSHDELIMTRNDLRDELSKLGANDAYNEPRSARLLRTRVQDLLDHISVTDNIKL